MGPCCPLHTLTAALAVAADAGAPYVTVAPGGVCPVVFSSDAGETFPIVVPSSVTLAGDDGGCATIDFDSPDGGVAVSLLGQSSIEGFTIEPALPDAAYVGIACDTGTDGSSPLPAYIQDCVLRGGSVATKTFPGISTPSSCSCLLELSGTSVHGFGTGVQIYWPAGFQTVVVTHCDISGNSVGLELWAPQGATPTLLGPSTWVHDNVGDQIDVDTGPAGGWTLTGAWIPWSSCSTPLIVSGYKPGYGIRAGSSNPTVTIGDVQFPDGEPIEGTDYGCSTSCGSQVAIDDPCDGGFDGG